MNVQDVFELAKRRKKSLVFKPDQKLILLMEEDASETFDLLKGIIVYHIKDNQTVEKLDMKKIIEECTKTIAKHIRPEALLKNLLRDLSPTEISEVYDRAVVRKGKIKTKNGCFEIQICGKRGSPFKINLVRGE